MERLRRVTTLDQPIDFSRLASRVPFLLLRRQLLPPFCFFSRCVIFLCSVWPALPDWVPGTQVWRWAHNGGFQYFQICSHSPHQSALSTSLPPPPHHQDSSGHKVNLLPIPEQFFYFVNGFGPKQCLIYFSEKSTEFCRGIWVVQHKEIFRSICYKPQVGTYSSLTRLVQLRTWPVISC